jgi:predicted phosphoadenosine phosphosulfate sulfurtransferase
MGLKSNSTFEQKIRVYIRVWEKRGYSSGIPDEADDNLEFLGKVPSYRRIVQAILNNDWHLTSLGYQRPKCEAYMNLKRVEIEARGKKP